MRMPRTGFRLSGRRDVDMTEGNIARHLVNFALPLLIGNIFQQFYNTVDTWVVGNYVSNEAFSAVGTVGPVINMLIGLFGGMSSGASVVIAQYYGAHRNDKVKEAVHTSAALTLILCVAFTVIGLLLIQPMLRLMKTPVEVLPESTAYLTIYFAGMSGLMIYNMGSGILRAVGDSTRPFYFLVVSAVLNIVLDLVFVIAFDMGVRGVGFATIIAQGVSALLISLSLLHSESCVRLRVRDLRINGKMLRKVIRVGIPAGLQMAITGFSNVFVQSYINFFRTDCMAGYSSYNKLDAFILIPVQSLALASSTFVGQNYGARKLERARQGVKQALIMSISMTIFLCALLLIFRDQLLTLFTNDSLVIQYGSRFIGMIAPFYFCTCFNQTFAGAMRGIGKAKVPMIVMLSSFVVFRQIFLYVGTKLGGGFVLVSLAYPMGWVVCSIAMYVCYKRSALCHPEKAQFAAADTAKDGNTEDAIETADEGIE